MKKVGVLFAAFLCALTAAAQNNQQPLATVKLAKTPEVITVLDVRKKAETYEKQTGRQLSVDERREVLSALIDEKLVLQAAKQSGLSITDADVNRYFIENISAQIGAPITEQQFAAQIKQSTGKTLDEYMTAQVGMNVADYKSTLKNQLLVRQYIVSQKQQEIGKIAATDQEIRDFYANNQSDFTRNEMLKLFLVVAQKGADTDASKKRITDVMTEIKGKPNTYDAVAARLSGDSAVRAGDAYIERRPQYAQRLGITTEQLGLLFSQNIGYVSEVTETPSDYQFYVIRDRFDAKMLRIDDEFQPGTAVTVYEYIKNGITQQKREMYFTATAIKEVVDALRIPQNFELTKKEEDIAKLLAW